MNFGNPFDSRPVETQKNRNSTQRNFTESETIIKDEHQKVTWKVINEFLFKEQASSQNFVLK